MDDVKEDDSGNVDYQQTSEESACHVTSSPSYVTSSPSHVASSPSYVASSPSHVASSPSKVTSSPSHDQTKNTAGKDFKYDLARPRLRPRHLLKNSNEHDSDSEPESVRLGNVDCQDLLFRIAEFEQTTCKLADHIDNKMDCNLSESTEQPSTSRCSSHEKVNLMAISSVCNTLTFNNFDKSSTCMAADSRRINCNNGQNCEKHVCLECGTSSQDSGFKFCQKTNCIDNDKFNESVKKSSLNNVLASADKQDMGPGDVKQSAIFLTKACKSNIENSFINNVSQDTDYTAPQVANTSHQNFISATSDSPKKTNWLSLFVKGSDEASTSTTASCGHKRTFDGETSVGFDGCSTKVIKYQSESEISIAAPELDSTKPFKIKKNSKISENRHNNNPRCVDQENNGLVYGRLRNESSNSKASGINFTNESESNFQVLHKEDNNATADSSFIKPELFRPQKSQINYSSKDMTHSVLTSNFQNESDTDCHVLFKGHRQKDSDDEFDSENDAGYPLHASHGSLDLRLRDHFPSVSSISEQGHRSVSTITSENESESVSYETKTCAANQLMQTLPPGKKDPLKLFDMVFGSPSLISSASSINEHIHIDCLPQPLILHIFGFLSLYDLSLRVSLVSRKWLSHTKDAELWRIVDLSEQIKVDDHVLSELTSRSDKVIHLDISDSKLVTNEGFIQVLDRCSHLHTLKIVRCHQMFGDGLKAIGRNLHRLTDLWMDNCYGLCDESLKTIGEGCSELRVLRMGQCSGITNSGLEAVAEGCPLLKVLMLDHCNMVGDGGLQKVIEKCPQLEELSLMACNFSDRIVLLFTKLKNLRKLDISNNVSVSKATIMEIAKQCCNLRVLGLSLIRRVDDECLDVVAKNAKNLERLHVVSCNLSDKALKSLGRHCKKLNSLDVGWCGKITDTGVRKISELCPLLTYLGLIRCDTVTAETIEALMRLYPDIKYSTFKLESRLLLERARLQGFISEEILNQIKS